MGGNNSGTTSWGVAITLIAFLIIVDVANIAYVASGASFTPTNYTQYNSSGIATNESSGVGFVNDVAHTQVTHDLPTWLQSSIYVVNALVLVLVYMLLRGIW